MRPRRRANFFPRRGDSRTCFSYIGHVTGAAEIGRRLFTADIPGRQIQYDRDNKILERKHAAERSRPDNIMGPAKERCASLSGWEQVKVAGGGPI